MPFIKNNIILIFCVFAFGINPTNGLSQQYRLELLKGKIRYNNDDFKQAIIHYKNALQKKSTSEKANTALGTIYLYELEQYDSSTFYLERVLANTEKDTNTSVLFSYAKSLRLQERPIEALKYFEQFRGYYMDSTNAYNQNILLETAQEIGYCQQAITRQEVEKIEVENIGFYINSYQSEYTPVFIEETKTLIYNARYKDSKKENQYQDKQFMENLYYFDFNESVSTTFDPETDQKYHHAIVGTINKSDSLLVFAKNHLWISSLEERRISDLKKLPSQLNNFYFQPHGVFYNNNNSLIFSAAPNEGDDLDLYLSHKITENSWTKPELLSTEINTSYNEDSPYLSADEQTLYFSSKGHNSSGGYDIFKAQLVDGAWQKPVALPYPINSAGDDIYFVLKADEKNGFLSSNRNKGFGLMDIYTFSLSPSPKFDCTPYPNPKLIVELDLTESVDPNSVPLKYIWTFDDGEVLEGEKLSKTFKYPGQQNIKIDIIDLISGKRETEEIIETIYLNDINYIGFKHEPVTQVDTNTIFDATISFVENSEFIEYYWSINDSVLETNQAIASYSFSDTGKYTVKMQVDVLTDGSDLNTYCYEDSIFVLSKEAYARYIPIIKIEEEQGLNTPDTLLAVSTTSDTSLFVNSIDLNNLLAKKDSITFDPIYFNFDKYDLTPEAQDKLDEIIVYLANNPSRNIIVYGHTDAMGSDEYNLRLSKKRANVSVAYLRSKGLKMSRIVKTVNLGETQPAKANKLPNGADNVEGRRLNRRVEFVIIY